MGLLKHMLLASLLLKSEMCVRVCVSICGILQRGDADSHVQESLTTSDESEDHGGPLWYHQCSNFWWMF